MSASGCSRTPSTNTQVRERMEEILEGRNPAPGPLPG